MIAHNEQFYGAVIHLDGNTFVGCTFVGCELIFSGLMPTLKDNTITDCKWSFSGAAAQTILFMSQLYRGGACDLIEKTFENIREPQPKRDGDPVVLN